MRPSSLHSNFFSSLKQVEKRLKLETPSKPSDSTSASEGRRGKDSDLAESLSTPMYLCFDQSNHRHENTRNSSISQESSEPPEAFLSCSPQFLETHQNQHQENPSNTTHDHQMDESDDIESLIQLLGLSGCLRKELGQQEKKVTDRQFLVPNGGCDCCGCECSFYEKIVGVKGPKCGKEMERLDGWIECFLKEKEEPLRLAFLLLGKAASTCNNGDSGFDSFEFPSAVDQFLKIDPPQQ